MTVTMKIFSVSCSFLGDKLELYKDNKHKEIYFNLNVKKKNITNIEDGKTNFFLSAIPLLCYTTIDSHNKR